jgi:gliding motility-associated-like protein
VVSVFVHAPPVADAGADLTLDCIENTGTIGGNSSIGPDIQYTWYRDGQPLPDSDAAQLFIDLPGLYLLEVLDQSTGCMASSFVTVNAVSNDLAAGLEVLPAGCEFPDNGILSVVNLTGGTEPFRFALNGDPFVAFFVFEDLSPGPYTVTIQDASGCELVLEAELPAPAAFIVDVMSTGPPVVELGESVRLNLLTTLDPGLLDTIIWTPAPEDCPGCTAFDVSPAATTAYVVTVVDLNGCAVSDSLIIQVTKNRKVFIANAFSPNGDGVNDIFFIQGGPALLSIGSLMVFDRWGGQIYLGEALDPNDGTRGWNGISRGKAVPTGLYLYQAELIWLDGETTTVSGGIHLVR